LQHQLTQKEKSLFQMIQSKKHVFFDAVMYCLAYLCQFCKANILQKKHLYPNGDRGAFFIYLFTKKKITMSILSNFELLINRIANVGDPTLPASAPFRRVVQGYFLTISNPVSNGIPITFNLRFTVNLTNITGLNVTELVDPNNAFYRGFAGTTPANSNHLLVVNREPDNNPGVTAFAASVLLPGTITGTTARQFNSAAITIGIGQTFSIALLPNTQNPFVINIANLAIRGYAEIEATAAGAGKDLIASAEHRGTFLDNNYPSYSNEDMDFDQIAYSMPMFGGGSKVTV
jgi:hypothetical protein